MPKATGIRTYLNELIEYTLHFLVRLQCSGISLETVQQFVDALNGRQISSDEDI